MSLHHTKESRCELCEEKLATAHEYLGQWFRRVKDRYPSVHVSWAWRGQADQDRFHKEGTGVAWPKSKHNAMKDEKPCSLALDLFEIDDNGAARFSPMFYAKLHDENTQAGEPIVWGGTFKSRRGDLDHFEMKG
jgi:hypothetical protein